jgi:hypothetical protein
MNTQHDHTATNPRAQKRTEERNAIAQLVKVTDSMPGCAPISAVRSFKYKPFGNLGTTTDPNGKSFTVKYNFTGTQSRTERSKMRQDAPRLHIHCCIFANGDNV